MIQIKRSVTLRKLCFVFSKRDRLIKFNFEFIVKQEELLPGQVPCKDDLLDPGTPGLVIESPRLSNNIVLPANVRDSAEARAMNSLYGSGVSNEQRRLL